MSVVLINDTTMTDIADAIRSKDGSDEKMLCSEMAEKIQGIKTTPEKGIIRITNSQRSEYEYSVASSYIGWTQVLEGNTVDIECDVGGIVAVISNYYSGVDVYVDSFDSEFLTYSINPRVGNAIYVKLIKKPPSVANITVRNK